MEGSELKEHASPKHGNLHKDVEKYTPMPLFSIIDFKVMPIRYCASLILQNFVASHLGYEDSKNRDDLMQIAIRMHQLNKLILEPEKVPIQIDVWSLQGVFLTIEGSAWEHDGCRMLLKMTLGL